jgi:hypothetical protein
MPWPMISPQSEGMEVSVTAIRKSTCSESMIHDMTRELSACQHRFTTLKKSVVACLATIVGLTLLVPQPASAEPPRTGPTKYKCQTVKETQCTAAPGGGGQLTNCHTVDVYSCTAVSGPGSAPNVGGGGPGPVRSPVAGPVWWGGNIQGGRIPVVSAPVSSGSAKPAGTVRNLARTASSAGVKAKRSWQSSQSRRRRR